MPSKTHNMGIDIGSTTAKAVLTDSRGNIAFSEYVRHHGRIKSTLVGLLDSAKKKIGNVTAGFVLTGSAGMGVSENYGFPFVQELVASADYLGKYYPDVHTLIDIGGEDSKIIFFDNDRGNDLRMNGSCAGGTGAFIDQMASLLHLALDKFDDIAGKFGATYPVASRCGVFAKTDVQNLLSRKIPRPDIAKSIFNSVAYQIKNSLLRGSRIMPSVCFSGGPLTFLRSLRNSVKDIFGLDDKDIVDIRMPEFLPAMGAAFTDSVDRSIMKIDDIINSLSQNRYTQPKSRSYHKPLFADKNEFEKWKFDEYSKKAGRIALTKLKDTDAYLGIDSGSTTTKIVVIDSGGRIAFEYYARNEGDPVVAVSLGLRKLRDQCGELGFMPDFARTCVTGYGEDLIRTAFDLDDGIVETIAHTISARNFEEEVSFILDIGGQDMKAIFLNNGIINNIEINEACSSGCGSFIETFSNSLNYQVSEFAEIACTAHHPGDLGTRCTVFMNSKVKQSFREGAAVEDISAGLAYSVVHNCLHKVLRLNDTSALGENIIVQGGTFRNYAVRRAFEKIVGKRVVCPDIAELMGAYGAALFARESDARGLEKNSGFNLAESPDAVSYNSRLIKCRGCENRCSVSKLIFENGNIYYTGNRCENIYSNQAAGSEKGENLPAIKNNLLFGRNLSPDSTPKAVLGIPRALNIFENFPFWARLLTECGLEVVISGQSDEEVANKGAGTVMSDNICFPARLVHGHIIDLIEKGVDRIFYPIVTYEQDEIPGANNCYNCPVVSGYPDVIRSSINPEQNYEVPIDLPAFTFRDKRLLAKNCYKYLSQFGITPKQFDSAFKLALRDMRDYKQQVREYAGKIAENAFKTGRKVILLAGRPYHIDPLINHDIPNTIADLGFDVITEDSIPVADHPIDDLKVLSQWAYPNRMYAAAKWAADKDFVEVVQLNSFGCGPDTIAIDEMRELLLSMGKNHTVIRIDEHSCAGSLRLRIRSLIESIRLRETRGTPQPVIPRRHSAPFLKSDRRRTILAPFFSPFHSAFVSAPFRSMGYNVVSLPPSDEETIDYGLRYVNNEICYPATLVIGDVLRALKSGDYDPDDVAVGITQTGGQCRASNYASLLKKALVDAGYGKVPVVGISLARNKLNHQPGFRMKTIDLVKKGILGAIYGDAISDMYYAVAPREAEKGHAARVSEKYIAAAQTAIERGDRRAILQCLAGAVEEFNALPLRQRSAPKVGLVGEIYVKYNPAGNNYIVNDLIDDGIHVVMPPLVNMFTQWLVNVHIKHDKGIENKFISKNFALLLKKYVDRVFASFDAVMAGFRFFSPRHELGHIADLASGVMDMTSHYFGEGWMIAGDISAFAEDGIRDVICLQPFGCIANHVIAKGIEKSLREKYPGLNILYLDIDSGASAVNLHNRLHLLLRRATENV